MDRRYDRPYRGVLESDFMPLLEAYTAAYDNIKDIKGEIPQWMKFLWGQRPGYGKIKACLEDNDDPAPPACRHGKKVHWGSEVQGHEFQANTLGNIEFDPARCRALAASKREVVLNHFTGCSLACSHKCEHSDSLDTN